MESLVEHHQPGHVVLHFAKGAKNRVAIGGDAGVVAGLGELRLRAARAAGENGFGRVGSDSPDRALDVQELGDIRGLPSAIRKKIQRGKVGGAGYADLRVGGSHLTLGFSDVRAALEKIGWQPSVQSGRLGVQLLEREMKIRSRFADQDGYRILKLLSLLLKQDGLRASGVEKGFFLRYIEARGDAASVARVHELQTLLQRFDSTIQN